MVELIRNQCANILAEKAEFSGPDPHAIIEMEGDEHVLQALNQSLTEEAKKSGFVIKGMPTDESIKQQLSEGKTPYTSFIIPFLCKIEFKLNPDIIGYKLTKIENNDETIN